MKLSLPRSIILFETTGFCLVGRCASVGLNGQLTLGAPARSTAIEFSDAVQEVSDQLREQLSVGKKKAKALPSTAALITPSVACDLIRLPVDPRQPRPKAQMNELVRWEFEEIFVEQNDIWSVGAFLMGRGVIDANKRREIEVEKCENRRSVVNAYRDQLTREQLEESLKSQEMLSAMDDELRIGWSAQGASEDEGQFNWLCAGISESVGQRWVAAFAQNGIHCTHFYPQLGAGSTLISTTERSLLIDVRQEQFALYSRMNGVVEALSVQACSAGRALLGPLVDAVVGQVDGEDAVHCILSAPEALASDVIEELKHSLPKATFATLESQEVDSDLAPEIQCSMEGVARHIFKLVPATRLTSVQAQAGRPPVWKKPGFWPWAAICLLVVGILCTEVTVRVLESQRSAELDDLDIEYERRMRIKSDADETVRAVTTLQKRQYALEAERDRIVRRVDVLENVIEYRQILVPGFLSAVAQAMLPTVQLNSVEETSEEVLITAWALNDTDAQRFGDRLNQTLVPWSYRLADLKVSRGKGRLGLDGYLMSLRLAHITLEVAE